MITIKFRKASIDDINEIAMLVTNLLGTCNIKNTSNKLVSIEDILSDNKEEISKYINNYYVCVCDNIEDIIIYEAWGDKEYVNSKFLLEKCGFILLKDLGETYYKDHNYCIYCVNRDKACNTCKAQVWVKNM